ncbi:hypothetical protein Rhom172_2887 (plasmid) [Rhodothermus marinus SG0.5JP17-172]|uniref:hypothetical protein n=1 Tax=Rhodothermus marinus TaxID=29549 RepID=UPI000223D269|nr:hypothetical protein [Rhodothermus marinus]AEN74764.1 hypothetical protein Rhom172_2887 [Rhodothermus marinus SG0.5JP17-172]
MACPVLLEFEIYIEGESDLEKDLEGLRQRLPEAEVKAYPRVFDLEVSCLVEVEAERIYDEVDRICETIKDWASSHLNGRRPCASIKWDVPRMLKGRMRVRYEEAREFMSRRREHICAQVQQHCN